MLGFPNAVTVMPWNIVSVIIPVNPKLERTPGHRRNQGEEITNQIFLMAAVVINTRHPAV